MVSHLTWPFLLLNVVLSEKKLKILIVSMNFTIHVSIVQWRFKMQTIKLFNSLAELPKVYNSYFEVRTLMYFFLAKTVKKLHKMSSTVFISWCAHNLPAPSTLSLLVSKEELKGKRTVGYPSIPFPPGHHFQHNDWLGEGSGLSKKGSDKVSYSFLFLRTPSSSFCTRSEHGKSVASPRVSVPVCSKA